MHIAIEASNIRSGGGVTHLQEVLSNANLQRYEISKLTIWAPESIAMQIGKIPKVKWRTHSYIEKAGINAMWFRKKIFDQMLDDVDLVWAPGGTYTGNFRPYVTMVQNFLPFELEERDRFKYSLQWVRLLLLERLQTRSFENATGLIHISNKTVEVINRLCSLSQVRQVMIYHGLNSRFLHAPRVQRDFEAFTPSHPARLLYVSPIKEYKHQDKLIQAVALLRDKGIPIILDLVGPAFSRALKKFTKIADSLDPERDWIRWHGEMPYAEIQDRYREADLYVCMSSCETFGMILLEAMASGLPILCSNKSALPEIQGGTCPEVDPEDIKEIAFGLERMLRDKTLRENCAKDAYDRAKTFSWERCADETFAFLAECARNSSMPSHSII